MIPDKLYLHRTTGNPRLNGKVHSYKPAKIRDDDKIIEYIRKDAILEWAEKKKNDVKKFGQRYNEANYYNSGCHDTIQELIDKINEL